MCKCICGKEFENERKLNGHRSHCSIYMNATGREGYAEKLTKKRIEKSKEKIEKLKTEKIKVKEQQNSQKFKKWVSEKHRCERCGKVMTEKFGSGRFCSRACANSHTQTKKTAEKKVKTYYKNHPQFKKSAERVCVVCGKKFKAHMNPSGKLSKINVCSKKCDFIARSIRAKEGLARRKAEGKQVGGWARNTVKNYKYGFYKNIQCDSSWELAYLVYNLDQGTQVIRNEKSFTYFYKQENHKYYPDFILPDGTYIEIKNYWTEQVQAKIDQFPKDLKYKILYYEDLKHMINYCKKTYGKEFTEVLYDKDRPSWLNKDVCMAKLVNALV